MPLLKTRKKNTKKELTPTCNFTTSTLNEFEEKQVSQEYLKERTTRYKNYLAALQPPQDNIMIRAASFTTDSILNLIQQSPGSSFIRVYYGIEESGEHVLFMAPVTESPASVTETDTLSAEDENISTEDDTVYLDNCCHCPPMGNCTKDALLEAEQVEP